MTLFYDGVSPSFIPSPDSTLGVGLESIESMKRAALYARLSTDAQQKEGTIESQLVELKKQITAAGHVLVKEYIDDGITGTLLDRPALEQLRQDAKTDLFDTIYFHVADRISREAPDDHHWRALNRGKKITIGGKDYQQNPENKMTLQMFGVFSEYERAKLYRGRGRLRQNLMNAVSGSAFLTTSDVALGAFAWGRNLGNAGCPVLGLKASDRT